MRGQHVADQRADAAIADDDDAVAVVLRRRLQRFGRKAWRPRAGRREIRPASASAGVASMVRVTATRTVCPALGLDEIAGDRRADHHEGEFAARAEQQRRPRAPTRAGKPKARPSSSSGQRLGEDQRGGDRRPGPARANSKRKIEFGPDRHEEQPEQQALERLDRHFDLASIFGLREQEPGDERAERHRQPAGRRDQTGAQHHEKAGGHEEFGAFGHRHGMKQRAQHNAARARSAPVSASAAGASVRASPSRRPALLAADQHRRHEQQRRDRQILEQQHREADAAGGQVEALASASTGMTIAVEDSDERRANDERCGRRLAEPEGDCARISGVDSTTWAAPRPKTSRRMLFSRSNDSSRPIMNKRNTTPNAATRSIASTLVSASASSQGARAARRPRPEGPSATPASRSRARD